LQFTLLARDMDAETSSRLALELSALARRVEALEAQVLSTRQADGRDANQRSEVQFGMDDQHSSIDMQCYESARTAGQVSAEGVDVALSPARQKGRYPKQQSVLSHDIRIGADQKLEHKVSESVYESALLIGLPVIGRWGSLLALVGLLMNITMQCLFIWVVQKAFFVKGLPSVEQVRAWRMNEGHDFVNAGGAGASLVSRVCNGDPSLIVGTDKQSLLQTLTTYSHHGAGVTLSMMVLFIWFLYVAEEIEGALNFWLAVRHRPTGRTRLLQTGEDSVILEAVSHTRRRAIGFLTLLRVALASALLFQGAYWLANSMEILDLVLNAAALAFILELDDAIFRLCATWPTKVLLADLEPLPRKHHPMHGSDASLTPLMNLTLAVVFVALLATTRILPMQDNMAKIMAEMCGDNEDWVYTKHEVGLIMAAPTVPYTQELLMSSLNAAIEKVVEADSLAAAGTVQPLNSLSILSSFGNMDTPGLVTTLVRSVMFNGCEDYAFSAPGAIPHIAATLRRELGNESIAICEDVRQHCMGLSFFVRTVCPETCGCSLPRSGLYRSGAARGCPVKDCQAAPKYAQALSEIPCEDPEPEVLQAMPAWSQMWQQWSGINSRLLPSHKEYYASGTRALLQHGCAGLANVSDSDKQALCFGNSVTASIADFCPVACNCTMSRFLNCPTSC